MEAAIGPGGLERPHQSKERHREDRRYPHSLKYLGIKPKGWNSKFKRKVSGDVVRKGTP